MNLLVHARPWRLGAADDNGDRHALGSGRMLVYGQGPDLTHVWGPPYTSTNLLALSLVGPEGLVSVSSRERTGPIWHHYLTTDGADAGQITDVVDCDLPLLVRRVQAQVPLRFALHLPNTFPAQDVPPLARYPGRLSLIGIYPSGAYEYGSRFRSISPQAVQVVLSGMAKLESGPGADGLWTVTCAPGESEILVAGGPDYPDCLVHAEAALALGMGAILARTRRHWAATLASIVLPALEGPLAATITQAAEDTALLLACQQSEDGGVVAGHNYCLAYVRDQYGVSRALLALGMHKRARAILEFYWRIFQREGIVHNAQSIGPHTRFHVHENDDVEMTGWLLLQAFDYLAATGEEAFLREIAPMLAWCADAQERHLVEGMLPFNGDETYIAGGILPRSALDDGSAEATLLYIASVRRFAAWCASQSYGGSDALARRRRSVEDTWRRYRANFFDGSRLMVNNPRRADLATRLRFRHGVCQGRLSGCVGIGWLELAADGRYACPACFPRMTAAVREDKPLFLPSVATTPAFIGFAVAEPGEQSAMLDAAMAPFTSATGSIRWPETTLPGYELGMLLYALAEAGDPRCPEVAECLLEIRDSTGAWVEYYYGTSAGGTRCRPWESAINLCGLLHAESLGALRASPRT